MVNICMAQQLTPQRRILDRVLARARELAEEVRQTAERVHQQAREAHRLTETARQQAERGRELSKMGREEARGVIDAVKWSLDTAGNGKSRASGGDET
jgi:methyl-accepting chemotaxis protein